MTTDSRHEIPAEAQSHSPQGVVPLDATFDALASQQCRILLRHLSESDDEAHLLEDLTARLATESPVSEESHSAEQRDGEQTRLRASLHHNYLPKLDDAGLLAYDATRGIVRSASTSKFEAMCSTIDAYEETDRPVSLDTLFGLLADFRRRTAYRTLLSHDELSLPDLADEVVVLEREEPLSRIDADDVLQVYLSLYHGHIPKLDSAGLVTYDQSDDYVTLTEIGRSLESTVRALCSATED